MTELQPVFKLPVSNLVTRYEPRESSLRSLRADTERFGQEKPVIVCEVDGDLELVDGAARLRLLGEQGYTTVMALMPTTTRQLLDNLAEAHRLWTGPARPGQVMVAFDHARRLRQQELAVRRPSRFVPRQGPKLDIRQEIADTFRIGGASEVQIIQTLRNSGAPHAAPILEDLLAERLSFGQARTQWLRASKQARLRMPTQEQRFVLSGIADSLVVAAKSMETLPPDLSSDLEVRHLRPMLAEMEDTKTKLTQTINKIKKIVSQEDPQ